MKRTTLLWLSGGFLLASAWASGCSNEGKGGAGTDAGAPGGGGQGGASHLAGSSSAASGGKTVNGGTPISVDCDPRGAACEAGDTCCSGLCDSSSGKCAQNLGTCAAAGTPCSSGTECCTLNCQGGACQEAACLADQASCSSDAECCSGACENGQCADLNGGLSICQTAGNPCEDSGDCCSKLCGDSGTCLLGSSYCVQLFDACTSDDQCCYGTCQKDSGAILGYCAKQESTGSGCENKLIAGEVCGGNCADCCSRSCAPFGPSGVTVCQPPSGCRPSGELCRTDADCCGGDPEADLPGAGNGSCEDINDEGVGRCKSLSCTPQGGICKYDDADYTEFCGGNSTSPNNCCQFLGNDSNCALDGLLIPRCDAIDECRDEGESCATSDDCCGGLPCVQNDDGKFVCYDPPGGDCVPAQGPCTNNADCCVGTLCILEPGQATGTCGSTTTGSGGSSGSGGNTGSGGSSQNCAEYGQACDTSGDCCNSVPCDTTTDTCRFSLGG